MGAVAAAGENGDDEWEPATEIAESLYRDFFKSIPKTPSSPISTSETPETTLTPESATTETASFVANDRFEDLLPLFACCPCKSHLHKGTLIIAVGSPEKIISPLPTAKEEIREKGAEFVKGSFTAAKTASTVPCQLVTFTSPLEHKAKMRCRKLSTAAYEMSRNPTPPAEKIVPPIQEAMGVRIGVDQEKVAELAKGSSTTAESVATLCLPVKFSSPVEYNAKIRCRKRSTAAYEMSLNPKPPTSLLAGDKRANSSPIMATPTEQPQKTIVPAATSEKARSVSIEQPVHKRRRSLASSDESSTEAPTKCGRSEEEDDYEECLKRLKATRRRSTESRAILTRALHDAFDSTTSTSVGLDLSESQYHRVVSEENDVKQGATVGNVLFCH
jgi:hypothetical protein